MSPATLTTTATSGTPVEVQNRYTGAWCRGFEVVEVIAPPAGTTAAPLLRIRRRSDGEVLPQLFAEEAVRPAA